MTKRKTKEQFVEEASRTHGGLYDYSLVEYKNTNTKVSIICQKHGIFKQTPKKHISGQGCPKCKLRQKKTTKQFIEDARKIHGDLYDYSLVDYENDGTKIKIICRKHGIFEQIPNSHLRGRGCKQCANEKLSKTKRKSTQGFIDEATRTHDGYYSYELTDYKGNRTPVTIICPEHGKFTQSPGVHLKGHKCPYCAGCKRNTEMFIKEARQIHGDLYGYSLVDYKTLEDHVIIICPTHGEFRQLPINHLSGNGCPRCGHKSKAEREIIEILESKDILCELRNRKVIGLELDIYIPDHKVAIEFNGLYWHSEQYKQKNYHLNKTKLCESKGIQLIHVWEDEWSEKPDIVIDMILAKCGVIKNRIYARKTEVVGLNDSEARWFLYKNHIQGYGKGSVRFGLIYNNELVAVMVFGKTHSRNKTTAEWELVRYATRLGTVVVGGASKLLKHFIKEYSPKSIVSYADRCVSNGNMYHKLGFELITVRKPDYKYVIDNKRYHKQNFTKAKIEQKFGLSGGTEVEMMKSLGYYRIWDCGKMVFVWYK